jgi:hypothetical protein
MRKMLAYTFLQLLVAFSHFVAKSKSNPPDNLAEEKLMKHLLKDYNPLTRPSKLVAVGCVANLREIIEIDEQKQIMSSGFLLEHGWPDDRLRWNKNEYNNLQTLVISARKIWVPDTIIQNIVASNGFITNSDDLNVIVSSDGWCHFNIPVYSVKTKCALNFKNFPFDEQTCSVTILSGSLASHRIQYYSPFKEVFFHHEYTPNSKWILSNNSIETFPYPFINFNEGFSFSAFKFNLNLTRNSKIFMKNTIMPFYIINAITIACFLLPYGQQISFCKY